MLAGMRNRGLMLAAAGFAVLLAATLLAYRLPSPRAANAPLDEFSAARAQTILKSLVDGDVPHPIGSAANERVRDIIVAQLESLGYSTELQKGFACNDRGACGTPTNIVAMLKGRPAESDPKDRGAVLLAAHYDSVPAGPGASDDGVGVAAVLEIARILAITPPRRHRIVVLITDGEEAGLLGAALFVREHPQAKHVQAAINMDARGTSGPSLMFETGTANSRLMHLYASAVARPITNSLYYLVYKMLPNDTDFTVFKAAAYQGFNFAFIGNISRYHTPLDTWANASLDSIQHQGDNALGALLALADSTDLQPPRSESVFFDVLSRTLLVWSTGFSLAAALAALAVLLAQAALLYRYGALTGQQTMWGITGALGNLVLGAVLGAGAILLLRISGALPPIDVQPWLAYPLPMSMAVAAMALASAGTIAAGLSRRAGFWGFWLGAALLLAVLSVIVAAKIPGASFALLLTALAAALAPLPCLKSLARGQPPSEGALDFAVLLPTGVFFAACLPLVLFLYPALGALGWPIAAVVLCLGTSILLPLLAVATMRARRRVIAVAAAVTIGGVLITLVLPTYSPAWPERINVEYWRDADADRAHWWVQTGSLDLPEPLAGAARFDPNPRARYAGSAARGYVADAPQLILEPPELTLTSSQGRRLELRLRSVRGAPTAFVIFPASANIREIIAQTPLGPLHAKLRLLKSGATRLDVVGLAAEGVEFAIDADPARMPVQVFDESYGLPEELQEGKAMQRTRPLNATSSQDGDVTVVQRTVWLDPAAGR
jgi:hypothetical protein